MGNVKKVAKCKNITFRAMWKHRWIYLMLVPVVAYYIIFKYVPMYGIVMAFQDYNVFQGVFGSQWVGFEVFNRIFHNPNFWAAVKNTLVLNILTLAVTFPLTIIVALMLNEIMSAKFKKVTQSILYLPHFVSWVVVAGIATNMFAQRDGTINILLNAVGVDSIPFLSSNSWWIFTYVIANVWKEIGWGTIIYLAALTNVDESLYEAAYLDGATKFQRLIYITLPSIKSVVVTMLILQVSKMMTIGLDAPLLLGNDKVSGVSEVISTYVYRLGIENARYSDSTAIGLFQSVVNIIILLAADKFAKAIGEEGII
ncbi:MAG: ABC transporter permease subunit [Lachnoclostridium edouardi]|uniref:ABC transporter permease n=1 Tax=Lachnoclostridium edouardi TaxID=1926283 RepID=UPI0026DC531C|nr:ABC transporter permease subunit [Lachnoclostridium edouardi]MDO4279986.1 ABC transporter permease subunit [Lachnoclostridium edouardi]